MVNWTFYPLLSDSFSVDIFDRCNEVLLRSGSFRLHGNDRLHIELLFKLTKYDKSVKLDELIMVVEEWVIVIG